MVIKEGVQLAGLDIRMRPALAGAGKIWDQHGQELVVTSGLEGTHSPGSLHYYGLAIDCRIRYFTKAERISIWEELSGVLGSSFDVVLKKDHIHVEYDP